MAPGAQVLSLLSLLEHWQIDAQELLAGSGLSPSVLEEPNARIPMSIYNALITRARRLTGEPALGIFLGLRRRASMYGFLGFAAMHAATLREVLELSARFSPTVSTAVKLSLHVEDGLAALREQGLDGGILDRVRSLLSRPDGVSSLEEVAAKLRLSARTLKRRLAAQGVSFSELLEEERSQRALLLLRSSQLSLSEITERLGYSTLPNFARAFRRWTGQTPAAYRRAASHHLADVAGRAERLAP